MRERPILFSTSMVRAILAGRKTMTRRICKDQTPVKYEYGIDIPMIPKSDKKYTGWVKIINQLPYYLSTKCPYGIPGDRLWVRETFSLTKQDGEDQAMYRADTPEITSEELQEIGASNWKHSIFMPRWASRITLEITNVRVERLQEITQEDAFEEGMTQQIASSLGLSVKESEEEFNFTECRKTFWRLWDSINGKKYPWSSNPWVFVIEFKKLEAV